MLRIRFLRTGKKNQPFFRIIVTDKRKPPRGGRFLEILGFFNPLTKKKNLRKERIKYWLSVGAQPSARVHNLLVAAEIIEGKKIDVHKKGKEKKVPPATEAPEVKKEEVKEKPAAAKTPEGKKEKPPAPVKAPEEKKEKPISAKAPGETPRISPKESTPSDEEKPKEKEPKKEETK